MTYIDNCVRSGPEAIDPYWVEVVCSNRVVRSAIEHYFKEQVDGLSYVMQDSHIQGIKITYPSDKFGQDESTTTINPSQIAKWMGEFFNADTGSFSWIKGSNGQPQGCRIKFHVNQMKDLQKVIQTPDSVLTSEKISVL